MSAENEHVQESDVERARRELAEKEMKETLKSQTRDIISKYREDYNDATEEDRKKIASTALNEVLGINPRANLRSITTDVGVRNKRTNQTR